MPNYTEQDIKDLLSEYEKEVFATMHREMRDDQQVIDASRSWGKSIMPRYLKGFPPNHVPRVSPYAKKGQEIATNHTIVGEVPAFKWLLRGETSDAMETRRKITEDFGKAFLQKCADRTTVNPFREMLLKQHGVGGAALSFPFKWDEWKAIQAEEDKEKRERMERDAWCWDVHVTPPTIVYFDPEHDPPEHYIIKDKITHRSAARLYPGKQMTVDKKGKVDRIIFCSLDQYTVIVGDVVVADGENPCGMLWHEWVWGGYGEVDENRSMESLGVGLIRHAKDTIARVVANENYADHMRAVAAFTPREVKTADLERSQQLMASVEFGPDKMIPMIQGETFDPAKQNEIPPSVQWDQEQAKAALELIFGQTILTGFYPEKTASGQRQRVDLAETPFLPAKVAAEQAVANMIAKVISFVKHELPLEEGQRYHIPASKYGPGMDVNPNDLLDEGYGEIDFTPPTAEDIAFNQERDARELERGVIDIDEYRNRQRIENGAQMDIRARKRRLIDSLEPVAQQVLQQRFMAVMGVGAQPGLEQAGQPPVTPAETPISGSGNELTASEATQRDVTRMFSAPQGVAV